MPNEADLVNPGDLRQLIGQVARAFGFLTVVATLCIGVALAAPSAWAAALGVLLVVIAAKRFMR